MTVKKRKEKKEKKNLFFPGAPQPDMVSPSMMEEKDTVCIPPRRPFFFFQKEC